MKKILILGGGPNQLSLIRAAKDAGMKVILCDYNPEAPGIPLADRFYRVSIIDREAVLDVARNEAVDGVVANTESVMQIVAFVCESLGLTGNSEESIEKLVSKKEFRKLQKEQGLFAPDYTEVATVSELYDALHSMEFPIVIKPSESSGTRGTAVITGDTKTDSLEETFEKCREFSRNDYVTLENYIPMPSLTVIEGDVFLNHGEMLWDGMFFTRRSPAAPMIPMTYIFPLSLEREQFIKLKDTLITAFRAAGISHGQYNVELFFTESEELFLIEINARQGGNKIPLAIKYHSGIDMDRLLVTTAVGDDSYWDDLKTYVRPERYTIWHLVFPRNTGILQEVQIAEELRDHIIYEEMFHKPGDLLQNTENAASCMGYVGLQFDNDEQMKEYAECLEELIVPVIL